MATYPLATLCGVSTTPGEATTVYNFSCTKPCSYWVFYILDFPEPLSGSCKNTLPCKVDTTSLSEQAKVTRSELQVATYGKDRMGNTLATSINVTRGNLMMVAQCVSSTIYIDGMMVRVGKSPITLHYSEGYNTITSANNSRCTSKPYTHSLAESFNDHAIETFHYHKEPRTVHN